MPPTGISLRLVGLYPVDYGIDRLSQQPAKSIPHFSHAEGGTSSQSNVGMSADSCGNAVITDYDLGFMLHT